MVNGLGGINTEETYELLVNKAKWGNLNDPKVYVDPESRRNSVMPKQNYLRLAQALVDEGENAKAVQTLDAMCHFFPNEKITWDIYMVPMVETYYDAEAMEEGNEVSDILIENFSSDLDYYASLKSPFQQYYQKDIQQALMVIQQLGMLAKRSGQTEQAAKADEKMEEYMTMF
jgi:hypothetical protein